MVVRRRVYGRDWWKVRTLTTHSEASPSLADATMYRVRALLRVIKNL